MSDKQFPLPEKLEEAVGVRSGSKQDVYKVALYQKILLVNLVVYIIVGHSIVVASFPPLSVPPEVRPILTFASFLFYINSAIGFVLVILLGVKVFHPINGVITAILVLVPLLGWLALLSIIWKASKVLRENGFQEGFLGANLSKVRAWADKEATEA